MLFHAQKSKTGVIGIRVPSNSVPRLGDARRKATFSFARECKNALAGPDPMELASALKSGES
jgi:hypothetical protein